MKLADSLVRLRAAVKKSSILTCGYYLLDDWLAGRRLARGSIDTTSGAFHAEITLNDSIEYIERVFRNYLAYAGCAGFEGTVVEVGPGDNLGVALLVLASGAGVVHTVDRYRPRRDPRTQDAIYRLLCERHGLRALFGAEITEREIRGVDSTWGRSAEDFFESTECRFDAILSRAVMEHVTRPVEVLDVMHDCLVPGGVMVHKIDFRDHGMFSPNEPLRFLTIPGPVYSLMVRNSGRPNRFLLPAYRAWTEAHPGTSIGITRVVGVDHEFFWTTWDAIPKRQRQASIDAVEQVRRSLALPFRTWPAEDIAVRGIVLVAHKGAN